ncbi:histidinol-phosphatase HisJ family protein [Candidatus Fermentibacteria bacterium]|nr:histidinol-phosphatase HisJ family protein [Candidatus Fermentibacteria bacterium]
MADVYDCHLHTEFSGDAELKLSWVLANAPRLGLAGVCPTEHFDPAPTEYRFLNTDLEGMFRRHRRLISEPHPVALGIGLEVTYRPENEDETRHLLAAHHYDLVIGAVHDIDGLYLREWLQNQSPRYSLRERLAPFFALTADMVHSGLFRVIGHIDYVKRYVPGLAGDTLVAMFHDEYAEILSALVAQGGLLEINLAGLRHDLKEPYPSKAVLDLYRDLGGKTVTIGSDAHSPRHYEIPLTHGLAIAQTAGLRVIDWRSLP